MPMFVSVPLRGIVGIDLNESKKLAERVEPLKVSVPLRGIVGIDPMKGRKVSTQLEAFPSPCGEL